MNSTAGDTVKIMTIHKSKGLEYHICYFSGFDKPFNLDDLKSRILFDNKYGIVIPFDDEGIDNVITKDIIKNNYVKEDISERIRLLYVALTRAKEKMIIVGCFDKDNDCILDNNGVVDGRIRKNYRSFKDIVLSIKSKLSMYFVNINLDSLDITHNYNLAKKYNYNENIVSSDDIIDVKDLNVEKVQVINKHFSKSDKKIISDEVKMNMELGTKIHELFEAIDFKNPVLDDLSETEILYVNSFLEQDVLKNIEYAKIYKEYEFIYEMDGINYHGIIDLMLVYDDYIDIIDYKLMNITSDEYVNQLNGYKDYIENSFGKSVNLYLYSIVKNQIVII